MTSLERLSVGSVGSFEWGGGKCVNDPEQKRAGEEDIGGKDWYLQ